MKKFINIALISLMFMIIVCGCEGNETAKNGENIKKVTIQYSYDSKTTTQITIDFETTERKTSTKTDTSEEKDDNYEHIEELKAFMLEKILTLDRRVDYNALYYTANESEKITWSIKVSFNDSTNTFIISGLSGRPDFWSELEALMTKGEHS